MGFVIMAKAGQKKKQIKDKLYGYIEFDPLELKIIDHPLFQRLKHIRQLGFAYNAYPSADHKRFEHSLGVVYVATEIFQNILNQKNDDLKAWLKEIKKILELDYHISLTEPVETFLMKLVRISALLHDVGHLPFSHTFEISLEPILYSEEMTALTKQLQNKAIDLYTFHSASDGIQIHERIGHHIIQHHFASILSELGEKVPQLICDIFELGKCNNKNCQEEHYGDRHRISSLLLPLQRILNGPIDADRLDYVARDHYSSGIQMGTFDRERLIKNFVVVKKGPLQFDVGLKMKALSAVNSFILMRAMLYRYLYQHHLVSMYDNVFALMVELMLKDAIKQNTDELIAFLLRLNNGELISYLEKKPQFLEKILQINPDYIPLWLANDPLIPLDDISWMSTLRVYIGSLHKNLNSWKQRMKMKFANGEVFEGFKNPYALIGNPVSLFDAFNNRGQIPVALWNNYGDYLDIIVSPVLEAVMDHLGNYTSDEISAQMAKLIALPKNVGLMEKLRDYIKDIRFVDKVKKYIAEEVVIHSGFKFAKTSVWPDEIAPPGKFDIFHDLYMLMKKEKDVSLPENLIISAKFPRTYRESIFFVDMLSKVGNDLHLEDVSPFISPLKHTMQDQPFFYVYVHHGKLDRNEIKKNLKKYREIMKRAIRNWLLRSTRPGSKISNLEYLLNTS